MSTLEELQNWFRAQCDGEWEHSHGISIESCDNPGWWVTLDLQDTPLEKKAFAPVVRGDVESHDPQPPWLHCSVKDGVFHGAGDPGTLDEILRIFLAWARGD